MIIFLWITVSTLDIIIFSQAPPKYRHIQLSREALFPHIHAICHLHLHHDVNSQHVVRAHHLQLSLPVRLPAVRLEV